MAPAKTVKTTSMPMKIKDNVSKTHVKIKLKFYSKMELVKHAKIILGLTQTILSVFLTIVI